MGIDFLDLRGFAARAEPIKLQDMPGSFEEALPDLEVEVTAESSIRRTYDIMDPPQTAKDKEVKNPWENLIESLRDS